LQTLSVGRAALKLHCYVVDTKSVMEFLLNPIEQSIIEVAVWSYQVSGEYGGLPQGLVLRLNLVCPLPRGPS